MIRIIFLTLALLFLTLTQGVSQERKASSNEKSDGSQPLSQADKDAVMQAIVDEMYANDLQPYVMDIGKEVSRSEYQVGVYFKPTLNSNRAGWVIYKLLPYGEVLRMFILRSDGSAVLFGKLRDRFPPTQPSYLTVYMDDNELCQAKKDWQKEYFSVELKPSEERVSKARARQQKRD